MTRVSVPSAADSPRNTCSQGRFAFRASKGRQVMDTSLLLAGLDDREAQLAAALGVPLEALLFWHEGNSQDSTRRDEGRLRAQTT